MSSIENQPPGCPRAETGQAAEPRELNHPEPPEPPGRPGGRTAAAYRAGPTARPAPNTPARHTTAMSYPSLFAAFGPSATEPAAKAFA